MKHSSYNIYHIFTMGFCGAESTQAECDGVHHRLDKIEKLFPYLKKLGINTILLGPLFSSISHGYDTTDYRTVDPRLGTNDDFKALVAHCHDNGFNVVIDCVFNHVGREFFAFKDLLENRENARYKDWFDGVNFWENNSYGDNLSYHNWAGCDNLVKLNLYNPEVAQYLKDTLAFWIDTFDIDGVRMDAANVMDLGFIRSLGDMARAKKPDFYMVGESVHGDYSRMVHEGGLDSVTNYEDYKGLYSSLNDKNYFEIAYSLNRLFGQGGLYRDFLTYNFADNHDVNRVASTLNDEADLEPLYLMLYTMPGIPSIYYGSEQGAKGVKGNGTDAPLRPPYEAMHFDETCGLYLKIAHMGQCRAALDALQNGGYEQLFVASCQMGYERGTADQQVYCVFNCENSSVQVHHDKFHGEFVDLYHNEELLLSGMVEIPAKSGRILIVKDQAPTLAEPETEQVNTVDEAAEVETTPEQSEAEKGEAGMKHFMMRALEEANRALSEGEFPVGAVVVHDGQIIAQNHNRKEGLQDPTAHAEMLVLREAAKKLGRWRLNDCELYVTAEPCPMCMGAVLQSRVKKLVYGAAEKRYGSVETTADLGHHPMLSNDTEIYAGICEDACEKLMQSCFDR